jgi:hypothetical protein
LHCYFLWFEPNSIQLSTIIPLDYFYKADLPDELTSGNTHNVPHVKATQVTTRTALTKEDKETNSTTSQIEEKTFTATTMTTGHRQEQRVVTQEVRTATILTSAEPTQVRILLDSLIWHLQNFLLLKNILDHFTLGSSP